MKTKFNRLFLAAGFVLGLFVVTTSANAQSRVYEKDLAGEWKLIVDLAKQGDNALERILLNAVDGIMDEVDIRFEFLPENKLQVSVSAMDSDVDTEMSTWKINKDGQLQIDETDNFSSDDVWMMKDGRLYAYEMEDGKLVADMGAYLERQ